MSTSMNDHDQRRTGAGQTLQGTGRPAVQPPEGHLPWGQRPEPGPRAPRTLWAGAPDAEAGPLPVERPRADDDSELATRDRAPRVRLHGLDVARALALVGMVAVHVMPAYDEARGEETLVNSLFAGNAAALFALLAGITLTLLSGGREPATGRRMRRMRVSLLVRALLLILIGLALNVLDFPAFNILPYYGVMFLMALPLVRLGRVPLFLLSGLFGVVGPLLRYLVFYLGAVEAGVNPTLVDLAQDPGGTFLMLGVTGVYPAITWMSYVCLGMALGRSRLDSPQFQSQVALGGAGAVLLATIVSWILLNPLGGISVIQTLTPGMDDEGWAEALIFGATGETTASTLMWQAVAAPHLETIVSTLRAAGIAAGVLGVVMVTHRALGRSLGTFVAALGSMTLTLYTAHLLFLLLPAWEDWRVLFWLIQVVVFTLFAVVWRRRVRQGPIETVVSTISKQAGRLLVPVRAESHHEGRRTTMRDR